MKLAVTLRQCLAIIAMVSLLLLPFASQAAMVTMQADPGMSMGGKSDCCPKPQMPGCDKSCPGMLCADLGFQSSPFQPSGLVIRPSAAACLTLANDAERDGLPAQPIPRPPKV